MKLDGMTWHFMYFWERPCELGEFYCFLLLIETGRQQLASPNPLQIKDTLSLIFFSFFFFYLPSHLLKFLYHHWVSFLCSKADNR